MNDTGYQPGDNLRWQQEHSGTLHVPSTTPLADALAAVDKAQGSAIESERRLAWARAAGMLAIVRELEALRALAEAVRVSLGTFSEGDVRTLAAAAMELWFAYDTGEVLTKPQNAVLGKAQLVFRTVTT